MISLAKFLVSCKFGIEIFRAQGRLLVVDLFGASAVRSAPGPGAHRIEQQGGVIEFTSASQCRRDVFDD